MQAKLCVTDLLTTSADSTDIKLCVTDLLNKSADTTILKTIDNFKIIKKY